MGKSITKAGKELKASDELKVGKNSIGWTNERFDDLCRGKKLVQTKTPIFQKLARSMTDAKIESELKPGFCSVNDVYTFIKNPPQEGKDGYANLFYFEACVVLVHWSSGRGYWGVDAWERDDHEWDAGDRVFSPATGPEALGTQTLEPSESLPDILTIDGVKYKKV